MDKILRVLQLLLVAVALWGCQSVQRKVVVVDSQTGAPVSGAFVYAYSYDAFDPLASHGLYLTDSNGEVAIKERCRNFAVSAGKEGYNYVKYAEPAVLEGDTLVSKLKLSPEEISGKYPVKIEMFRKFPSDNKTQSIVKQMYNYFSKRNVYMATVGEPYILEVEVYVVDADTNEPVNDAMLFVRSGSFANGHYEDIVATNSDGIAKVSIDLVSPSLRIDTGKEGYQPTKKFWKDQYKRGSYIVYLSKSKKSGSKSIVLGDTSEFSKRKTNIRLWERFKAYYQKAGGSFRYLRETR